MISESFQAFDSLVSVVCDHDFYIGHNLIGRTIMQVEDEMSDGVCELLGLHGCRTGKLRSQWARMQ